MKKVLLVGVLVLLVLVTLIACSDPQSSSTPSPSQTTDPKPSDTTATVTQGKNQVVKEDYTATLNDAEWKAEAIDSSKFAHFGTGSTVVNEINLTYNGYQKVYLLVDENGEKTEVNHSVIRKISTVGMILAEKDDDAKTVTLEAYDINLHVQPDWTAVTAKAGSYLMFNFTANCPADFLVTVTASEGGSKDSAAYTQDGITVTGSNGTYTGVAKCTVPYAEGKTFYINICANTTAAPVLASIPVTITAPKYDSPYTLVFQGDWELIKDPNYLPNLIDLFYNVYPRVYARFGDGTEPKEITFKADKSYDGVAYNAGTLVCVSTNYANQNPTDIGFFAHEITHAVQQYGGKMYYGDGAWWTEFMADLGRFRYFHWGYSTEFVKIYSMSDKSIRDFGWQPYGQHNIFAAYLDSRYPTTVDEDGNVTYGLVDSINRLIKATTVMLSDDPYKAGTPFNNTVKEVTGFETMEALRLHFVEELDEGTWSFTGYRDYLDNFQTEDIPGIPNPTYPMDEPVKKGEITNPVLTTPVTEGKNLLQGVTVVRVSTNGVAKNVIENLFDGDLTTKWQGSRPTNDMTYTLGQYDHEIVIDLGKATTFNTYTFYNASTVERDTFNMKEWEIFISDDGVNFTSIDLQSDQNAAIVSVNVGTQTARYLMIRIHKADQNGVGTARIYEMMLFNQE